MNMKKGNTMMIALIVVAVAAVGIIGYMIYNNNQQQAAADAQLAAQQAQTEAAQQEAQQAQAQAQAQEKHYISPRLKLGLHTKASLESPIKVLISSGTAVNLIKTEQEFSQIKTTEGAEGWVKSKFLTQEEPASAQLEKMKQALLRAQQLLKERLQEGDKKEITGSEAEEVEIKTASSQLTDEAKAVYEETISGLKEELKAWEQLDRQDKLAQKEQAEKNNRILKEKLAMIASVAIGEDIDASQFNLSVRGELPELESRAKQTFLKTIKKNYFLLLMISGLSFFLGIFVMDIINRKRHGGYRI
jgi:SH3 domain protein